MSAAAVKKYIFDAVMRHDRMFSKKESSLVLEISALSDNEDIINFPILITLLDLFQGTNKFVCLW